MTDQTEKPAIFFHTENRAFPSDIALERALCRAFGTALDVEQVGSTDEYKLIGLDLATATLVDRYAKALAAVPGIASIRYRATQGGAFRHIGEGPAPNSGPDLD